MRALDPLDISAVNLEPRGSVICAVDDFGPGLLQDCVVVNHLVVGKFSRPDGTPHIGCNAGIWALEVQDHALGHLLQRDLNTNLDDILWEPHSAALNMETTYIPPDTSFFLLAGNG